MTPLITTTEGIKVLIGLLVVFVPFHQSVVEIFKLTGTKTRRYWEALAYIIYGPTLSSGKPQNKSKYMPTISSFPATIDPLLRDNDAHTTPQERLIQSFLLRGVGDSPVTDISDSDVKNVIQVIRFATMKKDPGLSFASELIDELIRTAPHSPTFLTQRFSSLLKDYPDSQPVRTLTRKWIEEIDALRATSAQLDIKPAILFMWRNELNLKFFPAILRAERELPNALKAAEFQYVSHLSRFSSSIAGAEALIISGLFTGLQKEACWLSLDTIAVLALSFGALITAPRGTKSLLDAVIGLGNRMKG
ncbi:MAG: hypothetical protein ABL970_09010 [Nitrospira sp.]